MPDNYRRRNAEKLFGGRDGEPTKRQRLEQGRLAAEAGEDTSAAAHRRRVRLAQRRIEAEEHAKAKKEREALLDPDKHVLVPRRGRGERKAQPVGEEDGPENEEGAVAGFEGDEYGWLAPEFEAETWDSTGVRYPSVEHAFQAQKLSPSERGGVSRMTSREAKRAGAKALTVEKKRAFQEKSVDLMASLLRDKFLRSPVLQRKLAETGDKRLVHVNSYGDVFWGRSEGRGRNELGKLLEDLRLQFINGRRQQLIVQWVNDRASKDTDLGWTARWRRHQDAVERASTVQNSTVFVGRDVTACHIVPDHPSTSRCHAVVFLYASSSGKQQPVVADLGSAHGTYLSDGRKLKPFEPVEATPDIRFGESSKKWTISPIFDLAAAKRQALYDKISSSSAASSKNKHAVLVANLSYQTTQADLKRDLLDGVNVLHLDLTVRGRALVHVASDRDVLQLLACDGDDILGRKLRVSRYQQPPDASSSSS